jgi:cysteine synthase A
MANAQPPLPSLAAAVGDTPLIRLTRFSAETGCEILGKAEFLNPGGSIKDRAALAMLDAAERSGALHPGGLIVEGTAGNTGAALALFGRPRGYRCRFFVPESICAAKTDLLTALGAEVRRVPDRPCDHPDNFQQLARREAEADPSAWWVNQFDNLANHEAHYRGTAPEIWRQTDGKLDAVFAAVGSGGTLAGLSRYFAEEAPAVRVVCAAMWSWFTHGHLDDVEGDSVAEGIGQCRVTANVALTRVAAAHRIPDAEAISILHRLRDEEGLFVGLSAAMNVAAALREARAHGPGRVLVAILCDGGARYAATIHDPRWLAARGLPLPRK